MKQTIMVLALVALVVIVLSGCVHRPHNKSIPKSVVVKAKIVKPAGR